MVFKRHKSTELYDISDSLQLRTHENIFKSTFKNLRGIGLTLPIYQYNLNYSLVFGQLAQPISYLFHKSLATHKKDIFGFDNVFNYAILRVLDFFLILLAEQALMDKN